MGFIGFTCFIGSMCCHLVSKDISDFMGAFAVMEIMDFMRVITFAVSCNCRASTSFWAPPFANPQPTQAVFKVLLEILTVRRHLGTTCVRF